MNIDKWIRQPTNIHALGVVAGGMGVALSHLATGNPTVDAVCGIVAYVLVHLGIDDNSALEHSVTALTTDAIQTAQGHAPSGAKTASDAAAALQAAQAAMATEAAPKP